MVDGDKVVWVARNGALVRIVQRDDHYQVQIDHEDAGPGLKDLANAQIVALVYLKDGQ